MEAYKFETVVLEDGSIKLPKLKEFVNQKIELFFVVKNTSEEQKEEENQTIEEFLDEWTGFFSEVETDDFKYNRIMDKHR